MAWQKASKGVAFVKIDLSAMLGGEVAGVYNVRVTPTFLFFLDGQKLHELKGADVAEMRSQVDLLIHQAFPREQHIILSFASCPDSYCSASACDQEAICNPCNFSGTHPLHSSPFSGHGPIKAVLFRRWNLK